MPAAKRRSSAPSPPTPDDDLIGRRDAAELAGVHYNTIRLWENAGLLEPSKVTVGRRTEVRYRRDELEAVAEAQRDKRGAPTTSTSLELHPDALWGMVQDAGDKATHALEAKARAEVLAQQRAEELERVEARYRAELARLEREQAARVGRADARARAAEDRAAQLQRALVELAKPAGWALFRRRPIVLIDSPQPQLGPGDDTVQVPLEEPDTGE